MMKELLLGAAASLALAFAAGCAGAPRMTSADDVLRLKKEGADDAALLEWVQDPGRAFDLTEPDFARLSKSGINEAVIGELRWRTEMYRRSKPPAPEKHQHPAKSPGGDGHRH